MPGDRERIDRRGVQEFGESAVEADGSVLEVGEGEQDCNDYCRPLLQPVEVLLEKRPLNLDTPVGT